MDLEKNIKKSKGDNNNKKSKKVNEESSIENSLNDIIEYDKSYNFLINALNQANLTNTYNVSPIQANVLFVLVSPYYIDNLNLEGLALNIKINENGSVLLNNQVFDAVEIQPGVKVFGVSKHK